jgi:hypothetical protein
MARKHIKLGYDAGDLYRMHLAQTVNRGPRRTLAPVIAALEAAAEHRLNMGKPSDFDHINGLCPDDWRRKCHADYCRKAREYRIERQGL